MEKGRDMNWHINQASDATVVVLDRSIGIQDAAAFHEALLAVAATRGDVRLDAGTAQSVHSSIMQLLYALSQAVPNFQVTSASADFLAAEARVGFSLLRGRATALASLPNPEMEVRRV